MVAIQILFWIDFICPYCYIARQRIESVMKELNISQEFKFQYLSFELDPSAPRERPLNIIENFAKKYQITIEEAKVRVEHISQMGREEGIDFKYSTCKGGNTLKAHRLAKYVANKGDYEKTKEIIRLLYDAYFTKNLLISDENVLIGLGMQVGCSKEELEQLMTGDKFTKEVREDEDKAYAEGIHAVPYFKINDKEIISGCASKEEMKRILLKILSENNSIKDNFDESL